MSEIHKINQDKAAMLYDYIDSSNFYNNNIGIKPFDYSEIHIENCNFVDNITYGLGIISEHPIVTINYSNSWGCENGDYWENCPG